MIVRKLEDNTIVRILIDNIDEEKFVELNYSSGFMCVDSLPYSKFEKWKIVSNEIVVDDEANELEQVRVNVRNYKEYLSKTDFKMIPGYQPNPGEDLTQLSLDRNSAREYIRQNENV